MKDMSFRVLTTFRSSFETSSIPPFNLEIATEISSFVDSRDTVGPKADVDASPELALFLAP